VELHSFAAKISQTVEATAKNSGASSRTRGLFTCLFADASEQCWIADAYREGRISLCVPMKS